VPAYNTPRQTRSNHDHHPSNIHQRASSAILYV
jgi:hypothetical protein